jgi:hypothetical protein
MQMTTCDEGLKCFGRATRARFLSGVTLFTSFSTTAVGYIYLRKGVDLVCALFACVATVHHLEFLQRATKHPRW